ncbi:hypothetical protein LY90DRAFT_678724 [Neocallimastix californiae]|uniref:Bacteriophage/plasmid primase P4 C-terminal domain-containing protein n=1 Tax=Neocallimastix californiae TaxID=1754190 RepID=A0A1Y1YR65_9FUNG|nr:hypothetical protein LY90DRAFT_678724 [Neocallimastix californiae]|eukprot:ORY00469.1 hypothetical protein LY90DRAFT_678724 [Neocallimastix californiae]
MILVKTKESEITNNYHPIIYLLIILLKQNKDKHTKCYQISKINQSSNQEADYKYDIIDIIYQCMEDYGSMVVDKARLITIKNYYSKSSLTSQIIFNIFIVLYLGYLVFSEDVWYKFSYSRHGWEIISAYDLAKEINMGLVNKLTKLCNECHFKLENLPTKLFSFMSGHSVTFKNLYQLETFFYLDNFISRMDKSKVLRFEDCVYDFTINKPRPGMPKDFCLKSTNYNFHSENKNKVKEVKEFFEDIFVDKELIQYVLKILASTLTYGNKLRAIVFFIGSGRNGKSVSADKPSPQMVDLNCARVAICEEPDARSIAITGDTKAITGNVGFIKTRTLYKDVQAVSVDLLPIINTNDKLTISNLDNALIDRILVIPFTQRFINKMNISVLSSTQNINNPSIKRANTRWQGSRVQGYAEA